VLDAHSFPTSPAAHAGRLRPLAGDRRRHASLGTRRPRSANSWSVSSASGATTSASTCRSAGRWCRTRASGANRGSGR
jgi:hypothetical protein